MALAKDVSRPVEHYGLAVDDRPVRRDVLRRELARERLTVGQRLVPARPRMRLPIE